MFHIHGPLVYFPIAESTNVPKIVVSYARKLTVVLLSMVLLPVFQLPRVNLRSQT